MRIWNKDGLMGVEIPAVRVPHGLRRADASQGEQRDLDQSWMGRRVAMRQPERDSVCHGKRDHHAYGLVFREVIQRIGFWMSSVGIAPCSHRVTDGSSEIERRRGAILRQRSCSTGKQSEDQQHFHSPTVMPWVSFV